MNLGRRTRDLVFAIARQDKQAIQHLHLHITCGSSCCAFLKTYWYKKSLADVKLQEGVGKWLLMMLKESHAVQTFVCTSIAALKSV